MDDKNLPATVEKENKGVALLEKVYGYVLNGVPGINPPLNNLVHSHLSKAENTEDAIDSLIHSQKIKCATTGFLTGLGGLLTLPVTLPADLASSLYIEMRMIAAIAVIRGYNINDDQVKTMVYLCLAGNAAGDVLKQVGIKTAEQIVLKKLLPKLSREVITAINRKVGFRLLTKAGSKGLINLSKAIPIFGGLISGGWNWAEVTAYAKIAKKVFICNRQ